MILSREMSPNDWDWLSQIAGIEAPNIAKERMEILRYIFNNHRDVLEEAYKETQWPDEKEKSEKSAKKGENQK